MEDQQRKFRQQLEINAAEIGKIHDHRGDAERRMQNKFNEQIRVLQASNGQNTKALEEEIHKMRPAHQIASAFQECMSKFAYVTASVFSVENTWIANVLWQDEFGRFKIWAANIGAHQTGHLSLDFRLRDASSVREQVLRVFSK